MYHRVLLLLCAFHFHYFFIKSLNLIFNIAKVIFSKVILMIIKAMVMMMTTTILESETNGKFESRSTSSLLEIPSSQREGILFGTDMWRKVKDGAFSGGWKRVDVRAEWVEWMGGLLGRVGMVGEDSGDVCHAHIEVSRVHRRGKNYFLLPEDESTSSWPGVLFPIPSITHASLTPLHNLTLMESHMRERTSTSIQVARPPPFHLTTGKRGKLSVWGGKHSVTHKSIRPSINPWSIHDQSTINPRSIHDQSMISPWSVHDQSTINPRSIHDQSTINPRSIHDQSTINPRSVHDQSTINPRSIHDQSTINPRSIHDQSMISPRSIHDQYIHGFGSKFFESSLRF